MKTKTHRDLIERWHSFDDFADVVGKTYAAVQSMHHRNSISAEYFPRIVKAANRLGWSDITLESLHRLKRGRNSEERLAKSA